ncbi:MAG TPA: hypothetical protein PK286_08165 [Devosia sp.]|nr:hypothetical protein [Devosia sp.]
MPAAWKIVLVVLALPPTIEYGYRELFVKPRAIQEFIGQPRLVADEQDALLRRYFRVANIGPAIMPFCERSSIGCFSWERFQNVDVIVADSPAKGEYTVRVLRQCDDENCDSLAQFSAVIRPTTQDEASLADAIELSDECVERDVAGYSVRFCRSIRIEDRKTTLVNHRLSWRRPFTSLFAGSEYRPLASISMNFIDNTIENEGLARRR